MLFFKTKITIFVDFETWLVSYNSDDKPFEYFLYNRTQKKAEFLFTTRPELSGKKLNKMVGFDYLACDGLRIQAYLSLPPDVCNFIFFSNLKNIIKF